MKLPPHGTVQRFLGSEHFEGCDCTPCKAAWKVRSEARKSYSYYQIPKSVRSSTKGSSRAAYQKRWRESKVSA